MSFAHFPHFKDQNSCEIWMTSNIGLYLHLITVISLPWQLSCCAARLWKATEIFHSTQVDLLYRCWSLLDYMDTGWISPVQISLISHWGYFKGVVMSSQISSQLSSCFHSLFWHGPCCQWGSASSCLHHVVTRCVFGSVVRLVPSLSVEPSECCLFSTLHILLLAFSCLLPVFDQLDLVTYEEVVKLPAFKRKTLVLLGEFCQVTAGHGDICHHGWSHWLCVCVFVRSPWSGQKTHQEHSHNQTPWQICVPYPT